MTTATIPNRSIPIATLTVGGRRYDVPMNDEWSRFFRDLQVRTGGVDGVATVPSGGTGFSSYTIGDTIYADTTTSFARLNAVATGNALLSGGIAAAPSWGKIGLTTHVAGILGEGNGGTGFSSFGAGISAWLQDATSAKLRAAMTDETGTGALVFADAPTLIAPLLGRPTSGDLANCTGYPASAVSGIIAVANGGTGLASGTSGGILGYTAAGTLASSGALTANALLLGGGAGATPSALGSLGTTTTVLHGNAAGAPTFGAVSLTADVADILLGANGGTGNGFFAVSGPAASLKTFTFPNASAAVLTDNAAVTAAQGGTGIASYAVGDIVYASGATTLSKLADVATGNALISGGVTTAPSWGKVGLTTHVSGTLPVANGGTGITSFGTGVATWLGTPSSANLLAAMTDETGTGPLVFANTPALVTPDIGAATGASVNLTSTATASALIPTGSSVPTNGVYLPAANTVSLATNATTRVRVNGTGETLIASTTSSNAVFKLQVGDGSADTRSLFNPSNQFAVTMTRSTGNGVFYLGTSAAAIPDLLFSNNGGTLMATLSGAGQFSLNAAGKGYSVTEGSNCKMGTATLVAGTVVVSTTAVTANSRIFLTAQSLGTVTIGQGLAVSARTAGTSFTITSGSAVDTSVVGWIIFEPS